VVRRCVSVLVAFVIFGAGLVSPARGCTIFVLTDGERTLFFNNEDWSNPVSRVWFVPAPEGFHSCVYVGFDNNGSEGGMNSAGLAFDWVAGFNEKWKPYRSMVPVGGRTSERMLESCATVEEAIAFYEKYREPQFNRAKILVADKSGASAIIGARDGKLQVDRANHSRGFGYGRQTLAKMLAKDTEPKLTKGLEILRACEQQGEFATKYSSVFDLKAGEISIFVPGSDEEVKLNLSAELKRGAHYYDVPKIRAQLAEAPKPALRNMRSFLREFTAATNSDPQVTERVSEVTRRFARGKMRQADFTPELWKQLEPLKKDIRADLKQFGDFVAATFVGPAGSGQERGYRYKLEFKNAWVLEDVVFSEDGKLASVEPHGVEWKRLVD
jgi:hypothetical protein